MKKALLLDLDNTVYPAASISEKVFKSLYELIINSGEHTEEIDLIKNQIIRKPFQKVASEFRFSNKLFTECSDLLSNLTYNEEMFFFEDYKFIQNISCEKYLITSGFVRLQNSKIRQLGIEKDFEEIHIVDASMTSLTKKDVFKDIMERKCFNPKDVLVIGDDPNSEIQAAIELGIDAVVYNKINFPHSRTDLTIITDFRQLKEML